MDEPHQILWNFAPWCFSGMLKQEEAFKEREAATFY